MMESENLSRDDYFLAAAFLTSMRSKDPCTQTGACIVDKENKIVSTGYNGMPRWCSDDEMPWGKGNLDKMINKSMYVCHDVLNALMNPNAANVNESKIYCTLFPGCESAKQIIHSGIQEVIYVSDKHSGKKKVVASKKLLTDANIPCRQATANVPAITLDFTSLDREDNVNPISRAASQVSLTPRNNSQTKRTDYISWEEYFMFMALLSAGQSNIPNKIGACVVNELMQIVGIGFSCLPKYLKAETIPSTWSPEKRKFFICHAAINAILNKNTPSLKGCTLFITQFPCNECAKAIVQSGISNIIFYKYPGSPEHSAAKDIFDSMKQNQVTYREYVRTKTSLTIDLTAINYYNS